MSADSGTSWKSTDRARSRTEPNGPVAGGFGPGVSSASAHRWLTPSLEVRQAETELFSAIQDAETAQRGYLLTGDPSYLAPLVASRARLEH